MERFLETGTLWQELGNNQIFIRLAGISGALAVIFAAYGAHGHDFGDNTERFRTGNLIHFYHTLALLAVPLSKRPILTGYLFLLGILLFSGGSYFRSISGSDLLSFIQPVGGVVLIIAWITLVF